MESQGGFRKAIAAGLDLTGDSLYAFFLTLARGTAEIDARLVAFLTQLLHESDTGSSHFNEDAVGAVAERSAKRRAV